MYFSPKTWMKNGEQTQCGNDVVAAGEAGMKIDWPLEAFLLRNLFVTVN